MKTFFNKIYLALPLMAGVLVACSGDNLGEEQIASSDMLLVPPTITLGGGTTEETLEIQSNTSWTAKSSEGWLSLSNGGQGSGNSNLTITPQKNNNPNERTATLTITTSDGITNQVKVTQRPGDISLTATPSTLAYLYSGGEQIVNITCNTKWYAQSSVNWLKVNGYSSYPNDVKSDDDETWAIANASGFTLTIKAEENQDPAQKEGTILLRALDKAETVAINVTIGGKNAYITVSPDNTIDVPAVGQDILYSVSSNFNWQATISAEGSYATFKNYDGPIFTGIASTEAQEMGITVNPNTDEEPHTITVNLTTRAETGTQATQTLTINQAAGTKPVLSNVNITDITRNSATVKFNVSTTTLAVTECGLYYSKNKADVENTTIAPVKLDKTDGDVEYQLTNLSHGDYYYVRVYAKNGVGDGPTYSDVVEFKTLAVPDDDDNPTPDPNPKEIRRRH
ncbi:MAG: hypothetical protein J6W75_06910 [Bacteroidaceae bacterium]|nr:hypothetical protein [Bacteroidaceae bacterium]